MAKVDINVQLDLAEVVEYLRDKTERDWENIIACPTMSPEPYNNVIRSIIQ